MSPRPGVALVICFFTFINSPDLQAPFGLSWVNINDFQWWLDAHSAPELPQGHDTVLIFSLPCKPMCPALYDLKRLDSGKARGAAPAVTGHPRSHSDVPQGTLGHEDPLSADVLSGKCCLLGQGTLYISRNQPKEAESNRKLCFIWGRKKI